MRKLVVTIFVLGTAFGGLHGSYQSIPEKTIEELRSLPYGVSSQPSLIIRSRQVDKVRFEGATGGSQYGFLQDRGLIKEGLWINLTLRGADSTSQAVISFNNLIDLTSYNSLAIWVRSNQSDPHLSVNFKDAGSKKSKKQIQGIYFLEPALPLNEPVQIIIPFSVVQNTSELNWGQVKLISFEFGRSITKNKSGDVMEILGMGFIKQDRPFDHVIVCNSKGTVLFPVARSRVKRKILAAEQRAEKPNPTLWTSLPGFSSSPVVISTFAAKEVQNVEPSLPPKELPSSPSEAQFKDVDEIRLEAPAARAAAPPILPSKHKLKMATFLLGDVFYLVLSLVLIGGALFLLLKRGRKSSPRAGFGALVHKLNWPLDVAGLTDVEKSERTFWRKLSELKIKYAWLSPFNTIAKREPTDEYHGEGFLLRQIQHAKKFNIHLFPSICFVRTLYHFESFLSQHELFLTKKVSPSESHLSDEELRIRHIGYFPIWIPPYWQRKKSLPQKLLVAYGKMPGVMATSDSVQYNLRSPELRHMAIRVLLKIAKDGIGVRMEGAAALLNASLNLYWGGHFNDLGLARDPEFWTEVISAVKAQYPDFIFLADKAGSAGAKLLDLGFDYVENNHLMEILINQIRMEDVGSLETLMGPEGAAVLTKSVYDVTPLFRTGSPGSLQRQQSILGSMIVRFLPGLVEHDGQIPQELNRFFNLVGQWAPFRSGHFVLLRTTASDVLAFARWEKKVVYIVVANFSTQRKMVSVGLEPFLGRLEPLKLYLFNDALHGASVLNELHHQPAPMPAVAVLGEDLKSTGLTVTIPELSLRLFSVNLGQPVANEISSEVHELYKA